MPNSLFINHKLSNRGTYMHTFTEMLEVPVNLCEQTFKQFYDSFSIVNASSRWDSNYSIVVGVKGSHTKSSAEVHSDNSEMSETLITGQTSEDLLADFETLLNSGSINLGEDHQIVIITSPTNEEPHPAVAPTSTGEVLLFVTPQGPDDVGVQDKRRPTLGRPPVRRGGCCGKDRASRSG